MTIHNIIEKAIKVNFEKNNIEHNEWKETLKKLLFHTYISPLEDYDQVLTNHLRLSKIDKRYIVKTGLVKNYLILHV